MTWFAAPSYPAPAPPPLPDPLHVPEAPGPDILAASTLGVAWWASVALVVALCLAAVLSLLAARRCLS